MSQTPLADELARISREEFDRYIRDFRPLESKTIDSLRESTVAEAMDTAQKDAVRSRASLARMRERYGTSVTPDQVAAEARQSALGTSLNAIGGGNTAYLGDRDRQKQTLAGLMNVGQELRQQALGNYGSASGLEAQRAQANASNKAAYKQQQSAQKAQTYGAVASMAMMAAMMM